VHILDYKPDATTNKPIAQLAIYALVLTRLIPGLRLFDIKCAGLNEKSYARPKNRRRPSMTFALCISCGRFGGPSTRPLCNS
jgi:hypothetical protein